MDLTKIGIDDVKLAKYNPRKNLEPGMEEFEKIKMSIQKFGYVDPIIANKRTGNIVGGHQRWKVLKQLGYAEIDIIFIDVDSKTEKALNLALNKISGDWDMVKLKDVLMEFEREEVVFTGFSLDEIDELLDIPVMDDDNDNVGGEILESEPKIVICPNCGHEFSPK